MQILENRSLPGFNYSRQEFASTVLNRKIAFGKLVPTSQQNGIRGTVYFLHGGGADDRQFMQFGLAGCIDGNLRDRLVDAGIQLVLPCVGESFLHDHPTRAHSRFTQYFLEEVLTKAEANTTTEARSRYLYGVSMGGQAALNLLFRHPRLFAGAATHFATLIDFDFTDPAAVDAFVAQAGLTAEAKRTLLTGFYEEFSDYSDFQAYDPIRLAGEISAGSLQNKTIWFDSGTKDDYGLQYGAQALSKRLTDRQIHHHFTLVEGGKHDLAFLQERFGKGLAALLDQPSG